MHDSAPPIEPTPSDAPARETVSITDSQRQSLRELTQLASQCAASEAEIESSHAQAIAANEDAFKRNTSDADRRLNHQLEKIVEQFTQEQDNLKAEANKRLASYKQAEKSAQQAAQHEYDLATRAARQKLDQAVWLADSVWEGEQVHLKEESRKANEKHQSQLDEIGSLRHSAMQSLTKYGQGTLALQALPAKEDVQQAEASDSAKPADDDVSDVAIEAITATTTETDDVASPENDPFAIKPPAPVAKGPSHRPFDQCKAECEKRVAALDNLPIARLFVGVRPLLWVVVIVGLTLAVTHLLNGPGQPVNIKRLAIAGGSALGLCVVLGIILRMVALGQVRSAWLPLAMSLRDAEESAGAELKSAMALIEHRLDRAFRTRGMEVKRAKESSTPIVQKAEAQRDAAVAASRSEHAKHAQRVQEQVAQLHQKLLDWRKGHEEQAREKYQVETASARQSHESAVQQELQKYQTQLDELVLTWTQELKRIQSPMTIGPGEAPAPLSWDTDQWTDWKPPRQFASQVRFGQLEIDLRQVINQLPADSRLQAALPDRFSVPAMMQFPSKASMLINADREGRMEAVRSLQMLMTRLLTSLPAGRVHFTLIDPVGLGQNFAGFMHLADFDETMVGTRIWTDSEQIDRRLADLTEHMETVIQKYLRNEFETIDDYNAQAGELAEPYRFLVIADFPMNFTPDAIRRLNSIASTGARCGVYTLVARDLRAALPSGEHIDELLSHSLRLVRREGRFVWDDEVFKQFPLMLDGPPDEQFLTRILRIVGDAARDANRVEVPFDKIAPQTDQEFWSMSAASELNVPVGRSGATRLQHLKLGRGVAQHALIAGKTGSGKSTLLHAIIANLAMWYSPDEVELYLIDFKKGVEFKTYATHALPHARAIAVESDREFGLSVLQRIDADLARRGNIFRAAGVQDLASYRKMASAEIMPRTLLVVDEFQELFSEDDKLAQDSALLLDRLVRQGRAFGIHVLLGSQTIGGSGGLNRSTIGQMAVRIALQCSEADSQLILGDNNSAARLLTRPGEAIYNDSGGLVEANSPFQVAWLPDAQRDTFLDQVSARLKREGRQVPEPVVFEGNAPADLSRNRLLTAALAGSPPEQVPAAPVAWIGDPVAIKSPTSMSFRRQSGANALIVGQQEQGSMAILQSSILSLVAQHPKQSARFVILDGTAADAPLAGAWEKFAQASGQPLEVIEWRGTDPAVLSLGEELIRRQQPDAPQNQPAIFVIVYGLQRYRSLRKQEESFSFSASDEPKPPAVDNVFADLLRDGPNVGMHVMIWADTAVTIERTFDRGMMREFDHRILFQLSANDSSNLIDSPVANKLGFYRAVAYSEEQGTIEKFRPYAMADLDWVQKVTGNWR